ncbi:MAG: hypothetical protein M3442_11785 [Chloroflexota bacterium]|nr:hypothetical protein [Chloroflexota bacterium]
MTNVRSTPSERSSTPEMTLPDAPPPDEVVRPGAPHPSGDSADDAPPVAISGSEATSTVDSGTARETGEVKEHRGDTLDGSEGSATGGRTSR